MARLTLKGVAVATGFSLFFAASAVADPVTLRSRDLSTVINGELLAFEDGVYVLDTVIGVLRLSAEEAECEGEACPDLNAPGEVISLSSASAKSSEFAMRLVEGYASHNGATLERQDDSNPGRAKLALSKGDAGVAEVDLTVDPGGWLDDLLNEQATIATSLRRVTTAEAAAFTAQGFGDIRGEGTEHVVALDGLAVIVAPDNPVLSITPAQLARVFAGEIANWSQLGGADTAISLHVSGPEGGAFESFAELVMRPSGLKVSAAAAAHATASDLADAVAQDPAGIGVTRFADTQEARSLAIASECGVVTSPSAFNVKAEEYPLTQRLYFYTREDAAPGAAADFLDYALSIDAQQVIAQAGYVDQRVSALEIEKQGRRIANTFLTGLDRQSAQLAQDLTRQILNARRLSTTLRFRSGSSRLDNKAVGDVDRLAAHLADLEGSREVLVIGFTDNIGRFAENRRLSEARAAQVRQIILDAAPKGALDRIEMRALGYGPLSPVACNTTTEGRRTNRRVEIWIRARSDG